MSTYLSNTIYQCLQNTEAAFCLVTIVRSHHGKYNTTSRERDRYMCVFSIGSRRRTKRQEKMMLSPASSGKGRSKRRFFEGSSQCLSGLVLVKVWWWTHIYFGNNFTMSQHKDAETPRAGGEKCKQENRSCKRHGYDPVPVPLAHETCPSVPGTNKRHICQTHRKYIPDPAFTTIPSSLIPAVLWLYLFYGTKIYPRCDNIRSTGTSV